jgi:hypothetical protein
MNTVANSLELEVVLSPLISEALAYLTDGALLSLDEKPVIVPRHSTLQKVLASSMPIIPIAGDWGQGKSFIGKLLYRYSTEWKTTYVTYIRVAGIYGSLKALETLDKFYSKVVPLSKEAIPRDAKVFLSLMLPLMFSPNAIRGIYSVIKDDVLTTLPSDKELKPEGYEISLEDIARRVVEKLDKKYIIVLDELEQEPEIFSTDKLGAIFYLMRSIYDKSHNIPKVVLVLLIQEYARARFSNLIDQLRTHRSYQRAYSVIEGVTLLSSISDEEAVQYINELLKRVLGDKASDYIPKHAIDEIIKSVSVLANTRLKISVIRASLATILSRYLAQYINASGNIDLVSKLGEVQGRNRYLMLSELFKHIELAQLQQTIISRSLLPPKLNKLLSGKLTGFASYADDISKQVADDIAKGIMDTYKLEVTKPGLRSSAKGYKAWEIIVLSKAREAEKSKTREKEVKKETIKHEDVKLRLVVWARLSRLYKEKFNKDELLAKLNLGEDDLKTPTKILLIHTPNVATAKLQEVLHNLLITVRVDATLLTAMLIRAAGSKDPELIQGLTEDVKKSFDEVYNKNFIANILSILEPLIISKRE